MSRFLYVFAALLLASHICPAQKVAVKSNLLYDATTTINLGAEIGFGSKWSLDVSGNLNLWTFRENKKIRQVSLQPEARYWFCDIFNRGFVGLHLMGGDMNAGNIDLPFCIPGADLRKLKDSRYEAWFMGAGGTYGYSWIINGRWGIEAALGLGYIRFDYDRYQCHDCGDYVSSGIKNYLGFTKLGVTLSYIIK